MMRRKLVIGSIVLAVVLSGELAAQGGGARGGRAMRERSELEQRFRNQLAAVVKERLALNDEQMRRLSEVNATFDARRGQLVRRDRANRVALRRELIESNDANEARVSELLVESQRIARERVDLLESEQAELAKFLTAVQRARYLGLQEQMRQRIEQFRGRPPFMPPLDSPPARSRRPPGS